MKVKLGKLASQATQQALAELSKVTTLPATKSYWVAKFIKKQAPEAQSFQDQYNALIEKFGEKNDKGIPAISPTSEKWESFVKEANALGEIEIEIDNCNKIDTVLAELGNLSPQSLVVLDFLLNIEDAKDLFEEEKKEEKKPAIAEKKEDA